MEVPQKDPFLIRFFGRVGSGVGTGGRVLAEACRREGYHVQAFAPFPLKPLGEPTHFSVLFSHQPLYQYQPYLLTDIAVLLELAREEEIGFPLALAEGGWVLANTKKSNREAAKVLSLETKVFSFSASETAKYFLGKDFPNLVLIGALLKLCPLTSLKTVEAVLSESLSDVWGKETMEKNAIALRMSYHEMEG